ncbi:MAG: hypothetical protein HY863_09170 [Chloroflexi bacterium]|nr:hypothetical protein [Chloroflexota bacterium]
MSESEKIKKFVIDQLIKDFTNPLLYLVEYGSRLPGHDLDLIAVFEKNPPRREATLGDLDMAYYGLSQVEELGRKMDFLITEPLLTGDLAWGNPDSYHDLVIRTSSTISGPETISYLLSRSFQEYLSATSYFNQYRPQIQQNQLLSWGLINLSFSIAYYSGAVYYHNHIGSHPLRVKELVETPEGDFLGRVRIYVGEVKNYQRQITFEAAIQILHDYENMIVSSKVGGMKS